MKRTLGMLVAAMISIAPVCVSAPDPIEIDALLEKMSLPQKIGQMMVMGYDGRRITPESLRCINEDCVGGYFLQALTNFNFPDELAALTTELQSIALENSLGIPLFFCLDAEGGIAAPIHYMLGGTPTPGNMALGASGREEDAYAAYNAIGMDMRACGANVNFAPAIDVLKNPQNPDYTVRSFGGSATRNAILTRGAIRGLHDAGVVPCAKHFPGIVYEQEDSHQVAPRITVDETALSEDDLAHFRAAIETGVDMIMTHHAFFDAWDSDFPVTLSSKALMGMLRQKMHYENVIITDSMGMGGINEHYGRSEATVLAVEAGCDIILQASRDIEEMRSRIKAIVESVQNGRIPERQIDESVRRILRIKAKYNLFTNAIPGDQKVYQRLARPEAIAANQRAALNGVVVVRDENILLPLPMKGKKICVICPPSVITRAGKGDGKNVGESLPVGYTLGRYVRSLVPDAIEVRIDTVPSAAEVAYARDKAAKADLLIVTSLLAIQSPEQVRFIKGLLALGKPTVLAGLGDPSDLSLFTEAGTFVAANSPAPISCEAAANVIFGKAQAGGTLPMPIGDAYPIGYSMNNR